MIPDRPFRRTPPLAVAVLGAALLSGGVRGQSWHSPQAVTAQAVNGPHLAQPARTLGTPVTIRNAQAWRLALSGDGRLLATAGRDGRVCVWEAATGRPIRTLPATGRHVIYLEFLPVGTRLVAGYDPRATDADAVKIWDVETGSAIASIAGDRLRPFAITVEGLVWTVSGDTAQAQGQVQIWDGFTGALKVTLEDRVADTWVTLTGIPVTFDGHQVRVRHPYTGAPLLTLPLPPSRRGTAPHVSLSSDGSLLALSLDESEPHAQDKKAALSVRRVKDGTILWDKQVELPKAGGPPVLDFAPGDDLLIEHTASSGGWSSNATRILGLRSALDGSPAEQRLLEIGGQMEMASLGPLVISPGGEVVVAHAVETDEPGVVAAVSAWSLPGPILEFRVRHEDSVASLAFSRDGSRFATADANGHLRTWGLAEAVSAAGAAAGAAQAAVEPAPAVPTRSEVVAVAVSRDRQIIAAALGPDLTDSEIVLFDARTGSMSRSIQVSGWDGPSWSFNSLAFSPDGTRVARAGGVKGHHGEVVVFDVATGREALRLRAFEEALQAVAFSPDGRFIVGGAGPYLGMVAVWDAQTGRHIRDLWKQEMLGTFGGGLSFSPDGTRLAVVGGGGVQVFETKGWTPRMGLGGLPGFGSSVAFFPDGRTLAASGMDFESGTPVPLVVWRMPAAAPLKRLPASGGAGLAVAPDGAHLADTTLDRLRVWNTATWKSTEVQLPAPGEMGLTPAAFLDERMLVTGGQEGVAVWDLAANEPIITLTAFTIKDDGPTAVEWIAISHDGAYDGSAAAAAFVEWKFGASAGARKPVRDPERIAAALRGRK